MKRFVALLVALALGGLCLAAGTRDLLYNGQDRLDVYPGRGGAPVVLWVHGGGWMNGDKKKVGLKGKAFPEQGFVLVSVNYALSPKATYQEQVRDLT